MILTVGGIKGGSGKTTIATNLAVMRALEGHSVLLIDADDQETASDFTVLRALRGPAGYHSLKLTGSSVRSEILKLQDKDIKATIIIDTGGRDTASQRAALTVSDVLLVPFVPRSFDVWTVDKIGGLVAEIRRVNPGLRAYSLLNRADHQGNDNAGAEEALKETNELIFLDTPLGARKAFSNASASGLAVTELRTRDSRAVAEVQLLYQYLFAENFAPQTLVEV
jgi:chromosome partitioning protein